jgi:hypothetical protein
MSLTSAYEEAYRQFLLANPRTLVYATIEYRNFLIAVAGGQPHYQLALKHGQIVGVLPYFRKSHPEWGAILNSLPWYGSHGGCTAAVETADDTRQTLLAAYAEALLASDVLTATLILTPIENDKLPIYLGRLKPPFTDHRIGQITCLPPPGTALEQQLLLHLRRKTRNAVRKALQQGFALHITDADWAWRFLYETHVENLQALGGQAKPWSHFIALRTHIPVPWRRIFVASLADQPVAALLLLTFNQTVEYFTPVIKHTHRSQQPLSFLIWHAMLWASREGFRWWNWGGTWLAQQSLYHFKAGWGAIDLPYTYLINVSEQVVSRVQAHLSALQGAFPYYYIFPYAVRQTP